MPTRPLLSALMCLPLLAAPEARAACPSSPADAPPDFPFVVAWWGDANWAVPGVALFYDGLPALGFDQIQVMEPAPGETRTVTLQVVVPFPFCYDVPIHAATLTADELYGPGVLAGAGPDDFEALPYTDPMPVAASFSGDVTSVHVDVTIHGDDEVGEAPEVFTVSVWPGVETYSYNAFVNVWIVDYDPAAPPVEPPIDWVPGAAPAVPDAPEDLLLGTPNWPDTQKVYFGWKPSPGATSYTIKRAAPGEATFSTIATGVVVPLYDDYAVAYDTTYCYVVSAVNAAGESADSEVLCGTPTAPPGCSGAVGDTHLLDLAVAGMTPAYDGGAVYAIPDVAWFLLEARLCWPGANWIQIGGNTYDPKASSSQAEAFVRLAQGGLPISPWSLQPYPGDPSLDALRIRVYRSWADYTTIWLVVDPSLPVPMKLDGLASLVVPGLTPAGAADHFTAPSASGFVNVTATLADPATTLVYVGGTPLTSGVATNVWAPQGSELVVRVYEKTGWALIGEWFIEVL